MKTIIKIIQLKALNDFSQLAKAPSLKPFQDHDLVIDLSRPHEYLSEREQIARRAFELNLVIDICADTSNEGAYHFDNILYHANIKDTPTTLYNHIIKRDDKVPMFIAYYETEDGKRSMFQGIKTAKELLAYKNVARKKFQFPELGGDD